MAMGEKVKIKIWTNALVCNWTSLVLSGIIGSLVPLLTKAKTINFVTGYARKINI